MWKPKKTRPGEVRRKRVTKVRRNLGLSKRRRFILVSLILSVGLLIVQGLTPEERIIAFVAYFVISYALSAWSLYQDLNGIEWFTNLILPSLFPVSLGIFYFLLPQHPVTRLIVVVLFAVGMYALLLTSNIFAVASIRTIQLLRAARAVGFLITVLTATFLYHLVLSFKLDFYLVPLLVFVVSLPLFINGYWSSDLKDRLSKKVIQYSIVSSLIVSQVSMALSFWPVEAAMGSIFLAMVLYVILGLFQHLMEERLFKRAISEYMTFGVIVFIIVVVSVFFRWRA